MRSLLTTINQTSFLFLMYRWLLLPLLLFTCGSFLEGPSYRDIVWGWPFVVTCVALPLLTAQFLHQVYRLHLALVAIPAVIIPAGYIHFAQVYYHGGKNEQYQLHITFFFILMCLLGLVYLYSLLVINPKDAGSGSEEAEAELEFGYEITLYNLDSEGQRGAIKLQEQGENELPEYITVDGFSKNIAIGLHEYRDAFLENDQDEYSTDVTTYETIVKFGEPMQLVDKYQLVLKIT